MKKFSKIILAAVLAAVMCMPVVACGGTGGGGTTPPIDGGNNMQRPNDFLDDVNRRPARQPFVDNAPEDDGTLSDHFFEFENAKFSGVSNNKDHRCAANSFAFNGGFGGNICMKNMSPGVSYTFVVESDKEVRVPLDLRMSNSYIGGQELAQAFAITNNGHNVADMSAIVPKEGETPPGASSTYFTMVTAESKVSLVKGLNTIVISTSTAACPNLDYINIRTSAKLIDRTVCNWPNAEDIATVTLAPTLYSAGTIQVACQNDGCTTKSSYSLPALTDEKYTKETEGLTDTYYIDFTDDKFQVAVVERVEAKEYTLTLKNAAFKGGTETSKSVLSGTEVALAAEVPAGKVIAGWYNVNDEKEVYEGSKFVMPNKNITIAPVFDVEEYAPTNGSKTGKVQLYPKNGAADMTPGAPINPVGGYIRSTGEGGIEAETPYWGVVNGEFGAVYHYKAGGTKEDVTYDKIPSGWHFMPLSPYKVTSSNKYRMTYTVSNMGTTEIQIRLYQTNSGGSPKPSGTKTEIITLAVGETKTVTIDFTNFSNNNVLTSVELVGSIAGFRLGMYQYIEIIQ